MKSFNELCNKVLPDIWRPEWKTKLKSIFGEDIVNSLNNDEIDKLIELIARMDDE